MNIVNTISSLVALSLVTLATSSFAITEEDSVHSWGPWETLVQPAAGPQVPLPTTIAGPVVPSFGAGDASQFTATPIDTSPPTVESALTSYALIFQGFQGAEISPQRALATLEPIPENNIQTTLTINSSTGTALSLSLNSVLANFSSATTWSILANNASFIQANTINAGGGPLVYGTAGDTSQNFASFIVGESTELAVIDDLRDVAQGSIEATYEGRTLNSNGDVFIVVNFTAGTWEGEFNGGEDTGVVSQRLSNDGTNVLTGSVGFEASGIIDGANIISTEVVAGDATSISGIVDASFFGDEGGVLAGIVDVDKTTVDYSGTYQDGFVAVDGDKVDALPTEILMDAQ